MIRAMHFVQGQGGLLRTEKHILGLSRAVKNIILSKAPHSLTSPHGDPALLSGLTVFLPFNWNNPQQLFTEKTMADHVVSELLKKQIQIRSIGFQNSGSEKQSSEYIHALRVSTGYFNSAEQIEIFKDALQDVLTRLS